MRKIVQACSIVLTVLTVSQTVFAATGVELGDISKGNHPDAPYAASKIIVPRPEKSMYSTKTVQERDCMPIDISGHWAEPAISALYQRGYLSDASFQPNTPATYGDFAELVSHFGLKPVTFYGGQNSGRIFSDRFSWNPMQEPDCSALRCGEAGVWGNPDASPKGIFLSLEQPAQRQYIAYFLSQFLPRQAGQTEVPFTDIAGCAQPVRTAISKLVNHKILSGFYDNTFRPEASVTKAEMGSMLYRLLQSNDYDMEELSDVLYGNYHAFYWSESQKLLEMVNQEREKKGIAPLQYDDDLHALCEIKNIERSLNGYDTFEHIIAYDGLNIADGHVSLYWGRASEMAEAFGLSTYLVGENAVKNAATAEKAYFHLTNSVAHRENYLTARYQMAGFSVGERLTYQMLAYSKR